MILTEFLTNQSDFDIFEGAFQILSDISEEGGKNQ